MRSLNIERVRIMEAIRHFNKSNKGKKGNRMTVKSLAEQVIDDRDILADSKEQLFSRFNNGKDSCPHHYVSKIAEITGVTTDYLLGRTENKTVIDEIHSLSNSFKKQS